MRIAHVCQDRGVKATSKKGAAIHLRAMRQAFRALGMTVAAVDEADPARLREWLKDLYGQGSLEFVYERYSLDGPCRLTLCREYGIPHVLEVNAPLEQEARKVPRAEVGRRPERR